MKLTFEIALESDYHIGSGYGRGADVDSALLRDADGVPVIRGSTLVGLMRDALRRLLTESTALEPLFAPHLRAERASVERSGADANVAAVFCAPTHACPMCRLLGSPAAPRLAVQLGATRRGSRPGGWYDKVRQSVGHAGAGGPPTTARPRRTPVGAGGGRAGAALSVHGG